MVMAEPRVTSPYLEGTSHRSARSGAEDLRVIGELPAGLEGMFVRTGRTPSSMSSRATTGLAETACSTASA